MDSDHRETSETHCFKCAPAEKLGAFSWDKFAISSMKPASSMSSSDKMVRTKALSNRDSIACKMAALATAKPGAVRKTVNTQKNRSAIQSANVYASNRTLTFQFVSCSSDSTAHSSSPEHMMDGYISGAIRLQMQMRTFRLSISCLPKPRKECYLSISNLLQTQQFVPKSQRAASVHRTLTLECIH